MTYKEKYMLEHPDCDIDTIVEWDCPPGLSEESCMGIGCDVCWNQEIPGTEPVKEETHCRAEKIDFEVAYEDLKVDHEKLMKDYEELNTTVIHQKSHIRRLQDEILFLRACVLKAVGGKPAEMYKGGVENDI